MTYEQMELLVKALGVVMALIITFVIKPLIDSRVSQTELQKLESYIKAGVKCAEQIFNTDEGQKKKEFVMEYVSELIGNSVKMEISPAMLSDLIEAFVYEVKKA